jgi:nucleoid-associated protein YgaU
MRNRLRALSGLILAIGLPAVALALLRTGEGIDLAHPIAWLGSVTIEIALTEVARLTALTLAAYVLCSTAFYVLAVLSGSRSLIGLARPLALPVVRRFADRVLAGTLVIGTLTAPILAPGPRSSAAPAAASSTAPSPMVIDGYVPGHLLLSEADPTPNVAFHGRPVTPPPDEEIHHPVPVEHDDRHTVVVERGDNLWEIAAAHLTATFGRHPTDPELAPYWRIVVEHNRSRLRSGNPDLIYPGEVVELPPVG